MLGRSLVALCWPLLLISGCSGRLGSTNPDAMALSDPDGGPRPDTGVHPDAAPALDLGFADAARPDTAPLEDAGLIDASAPDAGPPGPGCQGRSYTLCEDFEDAPTPGVPANWQRVFPYSPNPGSANADEVTVTTDQPHSGTKSLKSTSENCAQTRIEHDLTGLGALAERHWGRIYFYVDTPAPLSDPNGGWYHTTFVGLRGDNSGGGNARECRVVDMVENAFDQSVSFIYNVPDDSCCNATEVNPYDFAYEEAWHCAEWFVEADTNTYRFFLDGTELLSFVGNAGARLPECNVSLAVGAVCYAPPLNAPQNFTAWFDDLAIDDERIGCE